MDALDRLEPDRIRSVERGIRRIRSKLRNREVRIGGFRSRRAVIHCHTHLSHDCDGSIDEIAGAARRSKTRVVMVTDHARPGDDVVASGYDGERSGVLFVPGAEARNLLLFFAPGLDYSLPRRDLLHQAVKRGGMAFLSHLEELTDWDLPGLHGTEIYNLHASFMSQRRILSFYRDPSAEGLRRLVSMLTTMKEHPDAGFGALCETPDLYLSRWDEMAERGRITGIAANDSHANNALTIRRLPGGRLTLEDFRGRLVASLGPRLALPIGKEDSVTFRPDSYDVSFGHVGTHLLMGDLCEGSVRDCLARGRCYVGFDWIADTRGFTFRWEGDRTGGLMGDDVPLVQGPTLLAELPGQAKVLIKANGRTVQSDLSDAVEHQPACAGSYRLEAYLNLAGEERPWIFSNAIHVRG